jgi:hypothetical protein
MFAWVQRTNEIRTPVVLVIFFAAFPDFFHIGDFRAVSHSLIGLAGLMVLAILILSMFVKLNKMTVLACIFGASSHLIGDAYIGHIYPAYPFSNALLELHEFNTFFDLNVELALSALAILAIPLVFLWDSKRGWGSRTAGERKFMLLMSLLVIFLGLAELALFGQMNLWRRGIGQVLLMMPLFAMPLLLLLAWIGPKRSTRKMPDV